MCTFQVLFSSHATSVLKRLKRNEDEWVHHRYSSDALVFKVLLRESGRLGLFEDFFDSLAPFLTRALREDVVCITICFCDNPIR